MQPVSTNMGACVAVYTRSSCFTYVTAVNRMRIMPILGLTLDRAKPIIYQDVGTRFTIWVRVWLSIHGLHASPM